MDPGRAKAVVRSTRRIEGWLEPEAGYLCALLDRVQREQGIIGDIAEIGVHHGKSAAVLGAMVDPSAERLIVCDLFGAQGENRSASGRGDREEFMANMASRFADTSFLSVHAKSSGDLTVEDVGRACRIFHIDGGHSCEEALGDLRLAAECVSDGGAVIVDDPFHPAWPGVTEAILTFLRSQEDGQGRFVALALGFNKLVLVRDGAAPPYRRALDDTTVRNSYIPRTPFEVKRVALAGSDVRVFHIPTYRRRMLSRSWAYRWVFRYADLLPRWVRSTATRLRVV